MLTKETESTAFVLSTISQTLQAERERFLKIRDDLDKIIKDHHIIITKLTDRH